MCRRALFLFASDRMGGAERLTRALAEEAALSGEFDRVECLVHRLDRTGTLDELEKLPSVSVHYTEKVGQAAGLLSSLRYLARGHFDFVFCSQATLNLFCCLLRCLGLLSVTKLVTRESTMIFQRDFGWRTRFIRFAYCIYGASDLIICQSDRMLRSLNARTSPRVRRKSAVLLNPIDLDEIFRDAREMPPAEILAVPQGRKMIVWCGRMIPVKAPLRALEVLHILHGMGYVDMHLVMIGDGPLTEEVKRTATELRILEFLTMTGHVSRPASFMSRCSVGLVTSEIEGFPNVILEMLAAGVPVVVTTDCAGGLADVPGVRVSAHGKSSELAAILSGSLRDPAGEMTASFLAERTFRAYFREMMDR